MRRWFLLAMVLAGCGLPRPTLAQCGVFDWTQYFPMHYDTAPNAVTPAGIPVDTTGQEVELKKFDRMAELTRTCILEQLPDLRLPPEASKQTYCAQQDFSAQFKSTFSYGCWQVKVPDNWGFSCTSPRQQVLADLAPGGCEQKGLTETDDCRCKYRMGMDGVAVVVPPSALLFRDALVRMAVGCANPWALPYLAQCASPRPRQTPRRGLRPDAPDGD